MDYKKEEIEEHFTDYINEQDQEWIESNLDDLHHYAFNQDYYLIGRYQATQWLGDQVFNVIDHIKEYEQSNFGEVTTDLSEPERVVNMYTYIIGEEVVYEWKEKNHYE
tara:strand:+ start:953 stop:1276 length:324 start_codon:yes stop_codon:yes gene_type:complete